MDSRIVWSARALSDLRNIIDYLEKNWTEKEQARLANLLESKLNYIVVNPNAFRISDRYLGTRECLIHKNLSLFYIVLDERILIVTLWDNRRNPKYIRRKR